MINVHKLKINIIYGQIMFMNIMTYEVKVHIKKIILGNISKLIQIHNIN